MNELRKLRMSADLLARFSLQINEVKDPAHIMLA